MAESRTEKSIKNALTGIIYKMVGIFFPFFIRTVMIKKLGAEYLGLNSLFTSILQVLSLSELGIGNAMVYSMYKPMAENNIDRVCALLTLYRKFYTIIASIILILGILISPFLKYLINGGYPSDINIYILYFIYLFNTVISYFLFAYKKSILDAMQKVSIENTIQTVITIIMYIFQIIVLIFTKNYYAYIILLPISTIVINIFRNSIIKKEYPQYMCRGDVEKEFVVELYKKIKALIGHKIGSNVIWFADSIVISAFLGLHTLAIYSNYYYIMNAIIGLLAVIYNAILASIGNSLVTEDMDKNHNDFILLNFANNWIVGWASICLICLYQPFMEMWMGNDMMFPFYIVVMFGVYFYSWMFNKVGNTYKNAAGMWREDFWKPYVSSIINLILNIILVSKIGVAGVLISTIVASVFIETPWEAYVLYKYMFKRSGFLYFKQLCMGIMVTILSLIITYSLCIMILVENIVLIFSIRVIICLIIPNIIYAIFFLKTKEFSLAITKFTIIIKNKIG
ncbi:lipopolysaccharide biosynthesis protein [Clostridium culturomicium]|uniref:lipopolysaccharide biosynthesis protein n=1 Tax=Clostridium culturomicium TaxID=1499683 RepID=UPI003857C1E8